MHRQLLIEAIVKKITLLRRQQRKHTKELLQKHIARGAVHPEDKVSNLPREYAPRNYSKKNQDKVMLVAGRLNRSARDRWKANLARNAEGNRSIPRSDYRKQQSLAREKASSISMSAQWLKRRRK